MLKLSVATAVAVAALAVAAVSLGGGSNPPSALAAPANDDFASATEIETLPFRIAQDVSDATVEFGERRSSCTYRPAFTVWYKYTAGSDSLLISDSAESDYRISISVFTDTQFGLAEIACSFSEPRLAFGVKSGETVYIQVSSLNQLSAGLLQIEIDIAESPPHDDVASARAVSSATFEETIDMFTATNESGEPQASCSNGPVTRTVWYRLIAEQSAYVGASVAGANGGFSQSIVAVYQGASLTDLTELACGYWNYDLELASFLAEAGQTYFLQVSVEDSRGPFIASGAAGFGHAQPTYVIDVQIETFDVPTCAPPEFTFSEPAGDLVTFGLPTEGAVDVTSVAGGHDGANYCVRLELAQPLPSSPEETRIKVGFDADSDWRTGESARIDWPCYNGLGWEIEAFFDAPRQVLELLHRPYRPPVDPQPIPLAGIEILEPIYAAILYEDSSVQLVVPLSALGDDRFHLTISLVHEGRIDCVPNGGALISPTPAPLGDANCDGAINSLDSTLLLQRFAGVLPLMLSCEYAGDVDGSNSVSSIDAVLILQYSAGLIDHFTPQR